MAAQTNPYEAERAAMMGYFQSIFVQPNGAVDSQGNPVPFLQFEIPGRRIDQPSGPWARISVQAGQPSSKEVGSDATRTIGFFTVEVFLPENTGTSVARQVADLIRSNFEYYQLAIPTGRIRFFEVGYRDVPSGQDGFTKANIETKYWTDKNARYVNDADFNNPAIAALGYIVLPPPGAPIKPPTTLGLSVMTNAALDPQGNIVLRNTTTGAYVYMAIQGENGAEAIVPLGNYAGAQKNLSTDAAGNMLLYNETTGAYLYPLIKGIGNASEVSVGATWVLPGLNWSSDANGNLLLFNVSNSTYQQVSFQGAAGQQYLQPINAP